MKSQPTPPAGLLQPANPPTPQLPAIAWGSHDRDAVLNATGLLAVARTMGVPAESALAGVAAMLAGVAGNDASIHDSWGASPLPALNLLTAAEDFHLQQWIERLVLTPERFQARLAQNMGRHSPGALELLACGAFSSPNTAKLADPELREKSLIRHRDTLAKSPQPGSASVLLEDLADDPVPPRLESVLHPLFLLRGADGRGLNPLVENCHQRMALVVQPKLGLDRQGSEPAKVMQILTTLLDGATLTSRPATIERGRDSNLLARARAILSLRESEITALHAMDPRHLNRFLWLGKKEECEICPENPTGCEVFLHAYEGAVLEILDLRRQGRGAMMEFESPVYARRFEFELRSYQSEIRKLPANAAPWAMGLPQVLFWALAFLRRSLRRSLPDGGQRDQLGDANLMWTAFAAARSLLEIHCGQLVRITNASRLADRQMLARNIAEMVSVAQSPLKFRDIARSTHDQNKKRIAPVVDALVEVGVLVRDEDGWHTPGPVELEDVWETLVYKLTRN